jgi:ubiquinone biosynthesis protein
VPVAAASIAQVHTAWLASGSEVVVKVRRPGIETVVEWDLDIIARVAASLQHRTRRRATVGRSRAVQETETSRSLRPR